MRPYLLLISILLFLFSLPFPSTARLHRRQSDANSVSTSDPTNIDSIESSSVSVPTDPTTTVAPTVVTPTSSSSASTPVNTTPAPTQYPTTSATPVQPGDFNTTSQGSPTTTHTPPSLSVPSSEANLTTMLTTQAISSTNANGSVVVVFQTEILAEPLSPSLVDASAAAASRNLAGTKISVAVAVVVGIAEIIRVL